MFGLGMEEINVTAQVLFSGPNDLFSVLFYVHNLSFFLWNVAVKLMHEIVLFPAIKMTNLSFSLSSLSALLTL